jgi:DNA-binding IclR family transcriptional regulator
MPVGRIAIGSGENQSVTRAIELLNLLADSTEPLGVRDIARRIEVAPSNVQRLINTLAKAGFLEKIESNNRYKIGHRAFRVGSAFVEQNNLYSAAMPELYHLASLHVTGFLGVLREEMVVYLATVQSEGPIAVSHRTGSQAHLHSTAMGKALLAEMDDAKIKKILSARPLPRLTSKTQISVPQLLKEIETIRRTGVAISEEENRYGFFSAGTVVRDFSGTAVAVISGAVPASLLRSNDRSKISEYVYEAAHNASLRLGAPIRRSDGHAKSHRKSR